MQYEADEMSTEVMENAANAASKRREQRRRRILMNPEERMKKLTGHSDISSGDPPIAEQNVSVLNGISMSVGANPGQMEDSRQEQQYTRPLYTSSAFSEDTSSMSAAGPQPSTTHKTTPLSQPGQRQAVDAASKQTKQFTRVRYVLFLMLGIIVRIAMLYPYGRKFVQSIVNPYVALEIAIIGYQQAVGMDIAASVKGGLWLSTLLLAGIKQEIIQSYKYSMGILAAAADDFTLFFFAFVVVHLVCFIFV